MGRAIPIRGFQHQQDLPILIACQPFIGNDQIDGVGLDRCRNNPSYSYTITSSHTLSFIVIIIALKALINGLFEAIGNIMKRACT